MARREDLFVSRIMKEEAVNFPISGLAPAWYSWRAGRVAAVGAARRVPGAARFRFEFRRPERVAADPRAQRIRLCHAALRHARLWQELEGEFTGRVICLEQVEDLASALSFLATHPAVDPDRIGVIGSSFGGAVAVYAGGTNPRVAAVISNGGWGHGERKFRGQHPTPEAWAKFTKMLDEGRAYRARTGQSR